MVVPACSSFGSNDGPTAPTPDADASAGSDADRTPVTGGPPISLSFDDAPPQILTGTTADITIKVQREGEQGFSGLVHIELAPIDGVTASPFDIEADHASGTITVAVSKDRKHGLVPLSIIGSSPGLPSTGSVIYTPLIRGPAGSVDTGFGTDGVFSSPDASSGTGLVVVNDKIFVGGEVAGDLAVVSLTPDGTLDTAFGTNGVARRAVGTLTGSNDLDILTSGTLYLGGTTSGGAIVGAFTQAGGAPAFGTNGIANIPFALGTALAASPSVASTTTFLVGGRPNGGTADSAVVMYKEDGTPNNFWPGGIALNFSNACGGSSDNSNCVPRGLTSNPKNAALYVCAWEHSGSALIGSNFDGTAMPTVETGAYLDRCTTTVVSAGAVYAAGDALGAATVIRISGSAVDTSFNPTGARPAAATAPAGSGLSLAKKVIAQEDGTILIAADAQVNNQGVFGVWRLTGAGKTDLDFGNPNGFSTSAVAGTSVTVSAMAVDGDNRIVVAGSNGHMVVTRFWQ